MTIATLGMGSTLLPMFGYGGASVVALPIRGCVHPSSRVVNDVTAGDREVYNVEAESMVMSDVLVGSEAC